MTQHKWHKEIKAWADGAEIEYRVVFNKSVGKWFLCEPNCGIDWEDIDIEYRIKPQPKDLPDCVKTWLNMGATMEQIEKVVVDAIDKQFPTQPKPNICVSAFVYKMIDGEIKLTDRFLDNGTFLGVTNIKLEQDDGTNE